MKRDRKKAAKRQRGQDEREQSSRAESPFAGAVPDHPALLSDQGGKVAAITQDDLTAALALEVQRRRLAERSLVAARKQRVADVRRASLAASPPPVVAPSAGGYHIVIMPSGLAAVAPELYNMHAAHAAMWQAMERLPKPSKARCFMPRTRALHLARHPVT